MRNAHLFDAEQKQRIFRTAQTDANEPNGEKSKPHACGHTIPTQIDEE